VKRLPAQAGGGRRPAQFQRVLGGLAARAFDRRGNIEKRRTGAVRKVARDGTMAKAAREAVNGERKAGAQLLGILLVGEVIGINDLFASLVPGDFAREQSDPGL